MGDQEASQALLSASTMVDHYKIVRLVGRGGMGEVFLARDTKLGRKVALKVVHPDALGDEEAAERFLHEARVTAKFSHPHIITIHGVGEHEGSPYVALEYLEGQTLRQRLAEERPGLKEALRIGLAISEALKEAHSRDVLHRDLKPENILIPKDGRLRVLDFGLARLVVDQDAEAAAATLDAEESSNPTVRKVFESRGKGLRGTPAYMAPEQWAEQPGSPATDMWSLGLILHELFSGSHPFSGAGFHKLCMLACDEKPVQSLAERTEGLTAELVKTADACLSKDPEERPTSEQVVDVLERLLTSGCPNQDGARSPFRGLLAFNERHADLFFGRDAEIGAFLEKLREEPVLPIVGPSGAGKSSFVQAGVVPRLREQGDFTLLSMRPGQRPFRALATRLISGESEQGRASNPADGSEEGDAFTTTSAARRNRRDEEQLAQKLRESPGLLALELAKLAETGSKVLLFVDQLEEVHTLVEDEQTRSRFMQAICSGADYPEGPVRVIFTLRDDFLGRLAEGREAQQALGKATVLRSPSADALKETLTKPVEYFGHTFEDPELVLEMVEEVRGEPAALPLVQFAAQLLWEHRDKENRKLTRRAYERIGGVAGALAQHADGALAAMTPAQERVARELFLRLVTAQGTKQIVPRKELLGGLGQGAGEVLERLTASRAILVRKGKEDAELELIHESLIQTWDRLRRWLEESREERDFLHEIGQAAELWVKRGRSEEEVWHGQALDDAQRKLERIAMPLPTVVQRFVDASKRKEQRRLRRRRWALVSAVVALSAITAGAVTFSFALKKKEREAKQEQTKAEKRRREAEGERAEAQREGARAALLRGELVAARAKLRNSLEARDSPLARALWWQLQRHPLAWQKNLGTTVYSVRYSPDGRTLAVACQDASIYLIDVRTLEVRFLRGHTDQVFTVAFSPDGKMLASGAWDGEVRLWDVNKGTSVAWRAHRALIWGVAFSPDGQELASSGYDGRVRIWRIASVRSPRLVLKTGRRVADVAYSPDGRTIVAANRDRTVVAWEAKQGRRLWVSKAHRLGLSSVRFSPDGLTIATGGQDGTVRLLDARTGAERLVLRGHTGAVAQVAYSKDGMRLASGGPGGHVRIWDPISGKLVRTLRGHKGEVRALDFSPDGNYFASGSYDKTVRVWQLSAPEEQQAHRGHKALTYGLSFHPTKPRLASSSFDGTVRLWDLPSGRQQAVFQLPRPIMGVNYSPDGTLLAAGGTDGTLHLLDAENGLVRQTLRGHDSRILEVEFSPDGKWLASGSYDRSLRLWNVANGTLRTILRGVGGAIHGVAFGPGGRRIAAGFRGGVIRLWDLPSGEVRRVLRIPKTDVYGVVFGEEPNTLYSAGSNGEVNRWDLASGKGLLLFRQKARAYFLDIQIRDGGDVRIGVPSSDHVARLWTRPWREPLLLRGHRGEVNMLRFSPDGKFVATSSDDSTLRLWHTSTGRPFWRAPAMLGPTVDLLTHRGWQSLAGWNVAGVKTTHSARNEAWRRAVEKDARMASEHRQSGVICIRTYDDRLQIWDRLRDQRLRHKTTEGVHEVLGVPNGCLVLAGGASTTSGGRALLVKRSGSHLILAQKATAIAWSGGRVIVATKKRAHIFSPAGKPIAKYRIPSGVRAMAFVKHWLVLGNRDGNLELVPTRQGITRPRFTFEDVPSNPVVSLLEGPMSTLVVGYVNGMIGIWNLANGSSLYSASIHGPVRHLRRIGGRLYAASELGDHVVVDLRVFDRSYCDLLREVWNRVPVAWQRGLPTLKAKPTDHRCNKQ